MRFGLWLPVYGGWLRATGFDTEPSFDTSFAVAEAAERHEFSLVYASENFLNCVHGSRHEVDDAWATLAGIAARTRTIGLVGAIKSGFRPPLVAAQMIATIDRMSRGRAAVNLVCGWWRREFENCEIAWTAHDDKYTYASRYLSSLEDVWAGRGAVDAPRRRLAAAERLPVWIAGQSEAALSFAACRADTLFVNGMPAQAVVRLRERLSAIAPRREPPLIAMSAFVVLARTDSDAERRRDELLSRARPDLISLYRAAINESGASAWVGLSDSEMIDPNGGFSAALVGSPATVTTRLVEYQRAGVDIVVCQFADMLADTMNFGRSVVPRFSAAQASLEKIENGVAS